MGTDEGMRGSPIDAIENVEAMKNLASGCWSFYRQLIDEGFSEIDALKLTAAWIGGLAGGKVA